MATVRTPQRGQVLKRLEETVQRNRQRIRRGLDILLAREEPPVGATPKEVIYSRGTLRVYRYRPFSDEVYRVPVVCVMSLVSKPWILDLTPGQSFVEYLLREGFDVFMVDWGVPRPEDRRLRLDDYVLDLLPRSFRAIQEATGEEEFTILGYCMGGLFGLMYRGIFHDAPVANLVCLATPVDFEGMGLFRRWSDPRFFDVDRLVDTLGNIPPDMMLRSFEMLRPLERWFSYIRLLDNLWDPVFVYGYRIMYRWVHEQIPFPGEAYRQFIRELMWENKLMRGQLAIGGRLVETEAVTCPVIHIMAEHDHIAPFAATRPLTSIVGSADKEDVILKGGHVSLVAGRNAVGRTWPQVARWLAVRSL